MAQIKLPKYDQHQWFILDEKGNVLMFTMARAKERSIKKLTGLWGIDDPNRNWKLWLSKGYTCKRVTITLNEYQKG